MSEMLLRMPDELHEAIKVAAKASNRTITGEVVHRLELSFADAPKRGKLTFHKAAKSGPAKASPDLDQRLATIEERLSELASIVMAKAKE